MYMTALRPSTPQDWAKADTIAQDLREAIEKYKDYHVALVRRLPHFHAESPASGVSLHQL